MKKPWRFTPKQVRKDQKHHWGWSKAYKHFAGVRSQRLQNNNKRELWLQLNNWKDEAIYQDSTLHDAAWHFW